MSGYRVIVTTRLFPDGTRYPANGHPAYSRDGAIEMLERLVAAGHHSDYEHEYGCWAESDTERFMLVDVDGGAA